MTLSKLNALRTKSRWAREKFYRWRAFAGCYDYRSHDLELRWRAAQNRAEAAVLEWIRETDTAW